MSGTAPTPASVRQAIDTMTAEIQSALAAKDLVSCGQAISSKMASFAQYRAVPELTSLLTADSLVWAVIRAYKGATRAGQMTNLEETLQNAVRTYLQSHPVPPKKTPHVSSVPQELDIEGDDEAEEEEDRKEKQAAKPAKKKAQDVDEPPSAKQGQRDAGKVRVLKGPMDVEREQEGSKAEGKLKKTEGKAKKAKKAGGIAEPAAKEDVVQEKSVAEGKTKKVQRAEASSKKPRTTTAETMNPTAVAAPQDSRSKRGARKRPLSDAEEDTAAPAKRTKADPAVLSTARSRADSAALSASQNVKVKLESQKTNVAASSAARPRGRGQTDDDDAEYVASHAEDSEPAPQGKILRVNLPADRKCERCTTVTGAPCEIQFKMPIKAVKVVGKQVKLACQDCREKKQKCEWASLPPLPSSVPVLRYDPVQKDGKGKGKAKDRHVEQEKEVAEVKGRGPHRFFVALEEEDESDGTPAPPPSASAAPRTNDRALLEKIKKLEKELGTMRKWVEEGPMQRIKSLEETLDNLKDEWCSLHESSNQRSSEWVAKFVAFKKQYDGRQKHIATVDTVGSLETQCAFHAEVIALLRNRIERLEAAQTNMDGEKSRDTAASNKSKHGSKTSDLLDIDEPKTQTSGTLGERESRAASAAAGGPGGHGRNQKLTPAHKAEVESDSDVDDDNEKDEDGATSDNDPDVESDRDVDMDEADMNEVDVEEDDQDKEKKANSGNEDKETAGKPADADGTVTPLPADQPQLVHYSDTEDMDIESPSPKGPVKTASPSHRQVGGASALPVTSPSPDAPPRSPLHPSSPHPPTLLFSNSPSHAGRSTAEGREGWVWASASLFVHVAYIIFDGFYCFFQCYLVFLANTTLSLRTWSCKSD
ncbi:hypothetical protein CPC08DRAFT_768268 [Agrocybe pediades]|nr:hypothetical protein CPC08DRAFT_768268 [Agrocybe pediades]